jgi:S-DNA-T family DNA segregation ATPase FtsK/SpoIIIE
MKLSVTARSVFVYSSIFSGFIVWSFERAFYRTQFLSKLRSAFEYCGLHANNKFPSFISDSAVDEHVRTLKLHGNGVPIQKFKDNTANLEAHFNVSMVKMYEEPNDKSRINLVYALQDLAREVHLDNPSSYRDGDIPIGVTFDGPIKVNMRDIAHLSVNGQTGGGKSNALKVLTTVLTENNPGAEIHFLDFKGGMELAELINRLGTECSNFFHKADTLPCAEHLAKLGKSLETRLMRLAKAKASSLDTYDPANEPKDNDTDGVDHGNQKIRRQYIIVDEVAELYVTRSKVNREAILAARESINRIARQGRAAGVHLIIATQRPDSSNFDQTVKSNIPAVLCFPMPSQAASISALGTKRAFDLNPEIKGRAIWKFGSQTCEVQTYLFS